MEWIIRSLKIAIYRKGKEKYYMKFPIGVSDFKKLIEGKYVFADKSLFIKDIVDDSPEVIILTRPRRFGKTLNLSILDYFLGRNILEIKIYLRAKYFKRC